MIESCNVISEVEKLVAGDSIGTVKNSGLKIMASFEQKGLPGTLALRCCDPGSLDSEPSMVGLSRKNNDEGDEAGK